MLDSMTGGAFGMGIAMRIKEVYSFLAANYFDGDEIILIGFSRGAFTARSVAGMIAKLGLLTREGIDYFYPIFMDMKRWNCGGEDLFPSVPFADKPQGPDAAEKYRAKLEELGLTRVRQRGGDGSLITVKAVACWDTVGSLGIPQIEWLNKIGGHFVRGRMHHFWNTSLSDRVEHAFHALALDESRISFMPAVWERLPENACSTDLRQVWFPGSHGNIGGGFDDQGMADITLAWMMDQLASIDVEFDDNTFDYTVARTQKFYDIAPPPAEKPTAFAKEPIYSANSPRRPWSLGAICSDTNLVWRLTGSHARRPGMQRQSAVCRKGPRPPFLKNTSERIHSSVRVRLRCEGLGLNDKELWNCPALRGYWQLKKRKLTFEGLEQQSTTTDEDDGGQYVWVYVGPLDESAERTLAEEPMGPFERRLLEMTAGSPNVWEYANEV
ncbi:hypothetical protein F5X68DRAFT_258536 [Plectosphaerella plurivora]|uniref:T6SS Phospholipase effector Tle1-like catalytic domain-containing protein n=1 Tax=Plectosphaerella plurivora TaxID=936078 RepID=A0A9P9AGG9_9PEZI|nr:hypothetical protein F5X68DRAFT_258536 [Plectosphaerella plurivora]